MVDEHIKSILAEADDTMNKALDHFLGEMATIRAGRATPGMVESVRVEFYGSVMPLNQIASVSAPQHDLLVIQPWDKNALEPIEKAIQTSNMGLNPANDGALIRIPVPPLSEERRKDLVKTARARGEDAKVAIRNIRRHAKDGIKSLHENEHLPEDMRYEGEEKLQKLTDDHIQKIDDLLDRKEAEIMEV
ncbi:MAG: ribosome recycling factor [Rhodothermales bacterium]|nr:ribosome recycling factor [Rhodothermales bacterium]